MRLTNLTVKNFKYEGRDRKVFDGHGLYLHVTKSGKYWRYKYNYAKREKKLSIGVYPDVSLKMARDAHLEARALLRKGLCPCAEKAKNKRAEEQKVKHTFEFVAREWFAYKLTTWSSRNHAVQINNLLEKNAFPNVGQRAITSIEPMDIMPILNKLKETPSTCRKMKESITAVFNYAIQTGRATSNPAQALPNPAVAKEKKHFSALPANDIGDFFSQLKQYRCRQGQVGIQLLMLTFVRPSELRQAQWSEFQGNEWHIPKERMKKRKAHVVPLSDWALELLEELRTFNDSPLLFPAQRANDRGENNSVHTNYFAFIIKRIGYGEKAAPHGFRSLASGILNESGLFAADVIERQLAHIDKNAVRAAYNRADYMEQRKEMMQWYSDYLKARY